MNLWQDFKAWMRGEKKVPGATKGRCYQKKNPEGNIRRALVQPKVQLVGIKVTRKDGTVEEYNNG